MSKNEYFLWAYLHDPSTKKDTSDGNHLMLCANTDYKTLSIKERDQFSEASSQKKYKVKGASELAAEEKFQLHKKNRIEGFLKLHIAYGNQQVKEE